MKLFIAALTLIVGFILKSFVVTLQVYLVLLFLAYFGVMVI